MVGCCGADVEVAVMVGRGAGVRVGVAGGRVAVGELSVATGVVVFSLVGNGVNVGVDVNTLVGAAVNVYVGTRVLVGVAVGLVVEVPWRVILTAVSVVRLETVRISWPLVLLDRTCELDGRPV